MLTKDELDAPAHLQYEPIGTAGQGHPSDVREFATLREAVHWAMNNEAAGGHGSRHPGRLRRGARAAASGGDLVERAGALNPP